MVRFAHIADCHLGSWRQQELQDLNFIAFHNTVTRIIEENVDCILIAGDLFDSAYPPIEILKQAFGEFKRIKDAGIPVFLIAGSHDYSASGRTFLDVLETAGFCTNVERVIEKDDKTLELHPTIFKDIAIYGYPGRKSGLEVDDLRRVRFKDTPHKKIFMLHTTISDVIGNLDMSAINKDMLPKAEYYALGHIHQRVHLIKDNRHFVYPGPTFPNNFQEVVDLQCGSFQITEITDTIKTQNITIPSRDVVYLEMEITNALTATQDIIDKINKMHLKDKVFLLKLKGTLTTGKSGDINFGEIEGFIKKKEVYTYLRNISQIRTKETGLKVEDTRIENREAIEKIIQEEFAKENPHQFNTLLPSLMNILSLEKSEEEKTESFEKRLLSELHGTLNLSMIQ